MHTFDRSEANTVSFGFDRSAMLVLQDNNLGAPYTMAGGIPMAPEREFNLGQPRWRSAR